MSKWRRIVIAAIIIYLTVGLGQQTLYGWKYLIKYLTPEQEKSLQIRTERNGDDRS